VSKKVHAGALHDYLHFGLTDHGKKRSCAMSPPPSRHYLEVPIDGPGPGAAVAHWSPKRIDPINISSRCPARVRELFPQNVRLTSAVMCRSARALSGGIDSSAIVTAIRRVQDRSVALHPSAS